MGKANGLYNGILMEFLFLMDSIVIMGIALVSGGNVLGAVGVVSGRWKLIKHY